MNYHYTEMVQYNPRSGNLSLLWQVAKLLVKQLSAGTSYIWPVENTVGDYRENKPVFSSYASNTFKLLYTRFQKAHYHCTQPNFKTVEFQDKMIKITA